MRNIIIFCLLICSLYSCKKKNNYPITPEISYKGLTTNYVKAGGSDTVAIVMYFTDGDGDIGMGTVNNITVEDSRDGSITKFAFPEIPTSLNPKNGVKGQFVVFYESAFLVTRTDTAHLATDTLHWRIYVTDLAGHQSNTITTDDVVLFN